MFCAFRGTRRVRYGTPGHFAFGTFTDGVSCDNQTFGDPAIGKSKDCAFEPGPGYRAGRARFREDAGPARSIEDWSLWQDTQFDGWPANRQGDGGRNRSNRHEKDFELERRRYESWPPPGWN